MKSVHGFLVLIVLLAVSSGRVQRNPVSSPEIPAAQTADPVLLAAGDIANCGRTQDESTAQLLDGIAGTVVTLGDNAYPDGTLDQFNNCFGPTWGRHRDRTRPSPGNHDYHTAGGAGYYTYFGAAASPLDVNCTSDCRGYYSYDLGGWHIIALDSEIERGAGSVQEQWLRADLAANQSVCTLAYWHKPLYSSGQHGNNSSVQAFWQALYDYGADVVLNGHDHTYERFAPQDPAGQADPARGIREFVVGTGGASLYSFIAIQPHSEVRNNTSWGVLRLSLHPTSYDWEFVPVAGQTFTDMGSAGCSGAGPAPTPTDTANPTDTSTPPATPTDTGTPAPSPIPSDTPTPNSSPTVTAQPSTGEIYVSSTSGGTAGGSSFADEDILRLNTATGGWSMYLDGSDIGLGATDVDAFDLQSDGSILLSLAASDFPLSGFGTVDDSDILRFTPTSLGTSTAGSFSWYFDGSDVGLASSGEDIDAIAFGLDGRLLISTTGSFSGAGGSGADEDLFAFTGTTGAATSGTFGLYFDGSDVGLNTASSEDVNGVWVDVSTGRIYLTTLGSFSVSGLSGDGSDIFVCVPASTGGYTLCSFGPGLYWDGSANGFGGEVTDGIDIAMPAALSGGGS